MTPVGAAPPRSVLGSEYIEGNLITLSCKVEGEDVGGEEEEEETTAPALSLSSAAVQVL